MPGAFIPRGHQVAQKALEVVVCFFERQPGDPKPARVCPLAQEGGFSVSGGCSNQREFGMGNFALERIAEAGTVHQVLLLRRNAGLGGQE